MRLWKPKLFQANGKADHELEGGIYNKELDILPPKDTEDIIKSTKLLNSPNGSPATFNGDTIDATEKRSPNDNGTTKSMDNLNPTYRVKDFEMNIRKADSTNSQAGFIVTEQTEDGLVLQLRAKSVELDIPKSE